MAIPKTPSQRRRLEPSSSQSTLTGARKRLNAGTPSNRSAPPTKRRKVETRRQKEDDQAVSEDAALQNAVAQSADQELQPAERLLRSQSARAVASIASGRETPPHLRSSPPPPPQSLAGRAKAADGLDVGCMPRGGVEGEGEEEDDAEQAGMRPPTSAQRPTKTPRSSAKAPTSTPGHVSTVAPKDMTPDELSRVAGSFTIQDVIAMQNVVTAFGERYNFTPAEVNSLIQIHTTDPGNFAKMLRNSLHNACPGYTRVQVLNKARKLFHNFVVRGQVWTDEQDNGLMELVEKHGNKWVFIGGLLHRHAMDVRDRHRTLQGRVKPKAQDKWDKVEMERLQDVAYRAQEVIQSLRDEAYVRITRPLDDDVPWQLVADMVGGQRTAAQCRQKWQKLHGKEDAVPRSSSKTASKGKAVVSSSRVAPASSSKISSKGKGVASSSSRGLQIDTRDNFTRRSEASVELGGPRSKYKSSERVEESEESEEVEDEEMGGANEEEEIEEEEEEIADSQSALDNPISAQQANMEDYFEDLPIVEEPLSNAAEPDQDAQADKEQEAVSENNDIEDGADRPGDEENPPEPDESRSRSSSPGIKVEQSDGPTTINGTPAEKSGSETSSEQNSSPDDSEEDSSDEGDSNAKNERQSSSSEASSDSSSGESEEGSSSTDSSSSGLESSSDEGSNSCSDGDSNSRANQRAESESSSDSDMEDIPNVPPSSPASARRTRKSTIRRLNW